MTGAPAWPIPEGMAGPGAWLPIAFLEARALRVAR